jgi:predicted permease
MKIPFIAGRDFGPQDTAQTEKVVILNEKAARRLWPGQNPIGQIALVNAECRVVGVVANVRHQTVEQEGGLEMYIPITQNSMGSVELVVRTRLEAEALAPGMRAALRSVDPALPTAEFRSLGQLVEKAVSPRRFLMMLLGGFAAAALILASIGIYGVVAYNVSQRTQEIGIRMALGASPVQVQRQVMTQTLTLVSGGILLGVVGSLALARLATSLLFNLQPTDPVTFGSTVGALLLVAALAAYLPALRASRVDPMAALRTQ